MNYIKDTLEYLSKLFQWWIIIQPWERSIRTRFGKNLSVLGPGTHFRIPFFDIVYIQTIRLRVVSMPPQTITSKDGKTITAVCAVGYSICDIHKLYNTLYQPEVTICNLVQGEIAEYVSQHNLTECGPGHIETQVFGKLKESDHGIKYEYVKMVGYAVVRTYRLIQDGHWTPDSLNMNDKK
jgi:hypothetical protein